MPNREKLKAQLRKAAKRRPPGSSEVDSPVSSVQPPVTGGKKAGAIDVIASAILAVDRDRDDINDRGVMLGLRSVLKGYPAGDNAAREIYEAVLKARDAVQLQPHPLRTAIDQLLRTIQSYQANRDSASSRAALTYLHSLSS